MRSESKQCEKMLQTGRIGLQLRQCKKTISALSKEKYCGAHREKDKTNDR